ncbi:hypothetical protein IWX49DRAFT_48886 [Phyllosticta citricarpa]|uniref:Uncharacterized protein n=1 Tax=Phyllosticta paracitricarpa TaxID=2016321 RepID=A0ABR1NC90_9PEZI
MRRCRRVHGKLRSVEIAFGLRKEWEGSDSCRYLTACQFVLDRGTQGEQRRYLSHAPFIVQSEPATIHNLPHQITKPAPQKPLGTNSQDQPALDTTHRPKRANVHASFATRQLSPQAASEATTGPPHVMQITKQSEHNRKAWPSLTQLRQKLPFSLESQGAYWRARSLSLSCSTRCAEPLLGRRHVGCTRSFCTRYWRRHQTIGDGLQHSSSHVAQQGVACPRRRAISVPRVLRRS